MKEEENKTYICIDLKSFYASVECASRGLDPLTTNLVVADESRTDKTICLAVSPSLKEMGIPSRPRLFEAKKKLSDANYLRRKLNHYASFTGESYSKTQLNQNPSLKATMLIAKPRMAKYIEVSSHIYSIYLRYIASEDIHVYSIDEVFIDATRYLKSYGKDKEGLARLLINEVLKETGITATAGIAENMYLAKVAMDIVAKHMKPDKNGVRMAVIDELSYRKLLWDHEPLTDFWRIGRGLAARLNDLGIYTMGDIALCSVGKNTDYYNEDLLYKNFGINAELMIDHAWGYEPVGMKEIKEYVPESNSLSSGQVLASPYPFIKAKIVAKEMTDQLSLDLVSKKLKATSLFLTVSYDSSNIGEDFNGTIKVDYYGRNVPKHSNGTISFDEPTSSTKLLVESMEEIFNDVVSPKLTIRSINVGVIVVPSSYRSPKNHYLQMNLFNLIEEKKEDKKIDLKEEKAQEAIISIKNKYGKNAVLKASSLMEGSTMKERNEQIGGHHK